MSEEKIKEQAEDQEAIENVDAQEEQETSAKGDETTQEEAPNEEDKLAQLEQKIEEQKDKYLRLFADFDNYKKRAAKERLELIKDAGRDIMSVFLPVLDDFNRAMKSAEGSEDAAALKEGMNLIYNKMQKSLEQKGLKPMESMGETFDPELHEALTEIPAPNEELKGKVVDVIEDGYFLNDKIIRHAKVVVGK